MKYRNVINLLTLGICFLLLMPAAPTFSATAPAKATGIARSIKGYCPLYARGGNGRGEYSYRMGPQGQYRTRDGNQPRVRLRNGSCRF